MYAVGRSHAMSKSEIAFALAINKALPEDVPKEDTKRHDVDQKISDSTLHKQIYEKFHS